jgi:hypothetical protein
MPEQRWFEARHSPDWIAMDLDEVEGAQRVPASGHLPSQQHV